MSELEQQALYEEGMMVSGISNNFSTKETRYSSPTNEILKNLNIKEIKDSSSTKRALFHALYQGPVHSMKNSTK